MTSVPHLCPGASTAPCGRAPHFSSRSSRCDTNCWCCSGQCLGGCLSRTRTDGLGLVVPPVDRVANSTRHRHAGDGHRAAPPRRPAMVLAKAQRLPSPRWETPTPSIAHKTLTVCGLQISSRKYGLVGRSTFWHAQRQSISRDSATSANAGRVIGPPRLPCRSRYNADCLRRNRFSAASWTRGCNSDDPNRRTSPATRAIVRTSSREQDSAMRRDVTATDARPIDRRHEDTSHDPFSAAPVGCRE